MSPPDYAQSIYNYSNIRSTLLKVPCIIPVFWSLSPLSWWKIVNTYGAAMDSSMAGEGKIFHNSRNFV